MRERSVRRFNEKLQVKFFHENDSWLMVAKILIVDPMVNVNEPALCSLLVIIHEVINYCRG